VSAPSITAVVVIDALNKLSNAVVDGTEDKKTLKEIVKDLADRAKGNGG